jgi:PAS domain S-box-containing protein
MPTDSGPAEPRLGVSYANLAAFAAGYLLAVVVGERVYGSAAVSSPFWFPDSVLLCALLVVPRSGWLAVISTAVAIRIIAGAVPGTPTWFVLVATAIDMVKGLAAAWWLQRVLGPIIRLNTLREYAAFVGIAALIVPFASALIAGLARQASGDAFWTSAMGWFMGDAVAQVIVTPGLLHWCCRGYRRVITRTPECLSVHLALLAILFVVFIEPAGAASPLVVYAPVPFMIWAAVRLGPFGTANAISMVAVAAMYSAVNDPDGFLGSAPDQTVLSLQIFLLGIAVPSMALAVVTVERENEARHLQVVLDAAPVAILTTRDAACREITANKSAYDMHMVAPGTNLSVGTSGETRPFRLTSGGRIIPPDQLPMRRAARSGVLVAGEALTLERADGTQCYVLGHAAPLWDENGKLQGAVGAFQDVTTMRLTEFALRESEARFRLVADTAPVMFWMSGVDRQCVYFNRRWLDFRGRGHDEEAGFGWLSGVHPDDTRRYLDTYATAFETRRTFELEYRLQRSDGEFRWIVDYGTPRFDTGGVFCGYIGSCLDITDRRAVEQHLRELTGRVITGQEEARANFARDLHDDIGQRFTLMQLAIQRFAQSTDGLSLEAHRQLNAILRSAEQISSDVQNMSHRLHPATLDALGLVTALRSVAREFGEKSHVRVHYRHQGVPDELAPDVCLGLFRVAQEALTNVVKHSGVTEARLELTGQGESVALCVSDQGTGFDSRHAASVPNGGLGLVSMRERLHLIGGDLQVSSSPSQGTAVRAVVPLRRFAPQV